jgi:HSP20 family protein
MTTTNPETYKNCVRPLADIYETQEAFIIKMDVPGIEKNSVDVTLDNQVLQVHATVKKAESNTEPKWIQGEYELSDYYRAFKVSDGIDGERIHAALEHGVLTIELPKSEALKPRKIHVA